MRDRLLFDDSYREQVAEELITRLGASATEANTIRGMLAAGRHPRAVENKILSDRGEPQRGLPAAPIPAGPDEPLFPPPPPGWRWTPELEAMCSPFLTDPKETT
jgi:hypothetical protein